MSNEEKNITHETMNEDFNTIIEIFKKYACTKESKKELKEIRDVLERFNNLSVYGKKEVMESLIWRVQGVTYDINEKHCEEKGHEPTKWRKLSYCDFWTTRAAFVEKYGSEYVWYRRCKLCDEEQIVDEKLSSAERKKLKFTSNQ